MRALFQLQPAQVCPDCNHKGYCRFCSLVVRDLGVRPFIALGLHYLQAQGCQFSDFHAWMDGHRFDVSGMYEADLMTRYVDIHGRVDYPDMKADDRVLKTMLDYFGLDQSVPGEGGLRMAKSHRALPETSQLGQPYKSIRIFHLGFGYNPDGVSPYFDPLARHRTPKTKNVKVEETNDEERHFWFDDWRFYKPKKLAPARGPGKIEYDIGFVRTIEDRSHHSEA